MTFGRFGMTLLLISGLTFLPVGLSAETDTSKYKVLANESIGLNINTVKSFMKNSEDLIQKGDWDNAVTELKKARQVTNLLGGYYRDLHGSFRGVDARIPREMSRKNREIMSLLAKTNLRLAMIHRKQNEPELAVPLLVEVIKVMSPSNQEGVKAYQALLDLGFVDTPYVGSPKAL